MNAILNKNMKVEMNQDKNCITVISTINIEDFYCTENYYDDKYINNDIRRFFLDNNTHTFVGVARLKDDDEINIENAKNIAQSKMERQFYKFINKCLLEEKKTITEHMKYIDNQISKTKHNIKSISNHIMDIAYPKD